MSDSGKAPVDFWFDFSSPYGYLMSERIDDLAARFGRKVRWHPILLGVVLKAAGSAPLTLQAPARAAYWQLDFARSARFMGIPYRHPTRFPLATQHAARAYYWLHGQDCTLARHFAHAVFRALFVDDVDISAAGNRARNCRKTGGRPQPPRSRAAEARKSRRGSKDEVDRALEIGVFGSPYVLVDGEAFFGADRLPQIEKWLETGGF